MWQYNYNTYDNELYHFGIGKTKQNHKYIAKLKKNGRTIYIYTTRELQAIKKSMFSGGKKAVNKTTQAAKETYRKIDGLSKYGVKKVSENAQMLKKYGKAMTSSDEKRAMIKAAQEGKTWFDEAIAYDRAKNTKLKDRVKNVKKMNDEYKKERKKEKEYVKNSGGLLANADRERVRLARRHSDAERIRDANKGNEAAKKQQEEARKKRIKADQKRIKADQKRIKDANKGNEAAKKQQEEARKKRIKADQKRAKAANRTTYSTTSTLKYVK